MYRHKTWRIVLAGFSGRVGYIPATLYLVFTLGFQIFEVDLQIENSNIETRIDLAHLINIVIFDLYINAHFKERAVQLLRVSGDMFPLDKKIASATTTILLFLLCA